MSSIEIRPIDRLSAAFTLGNGVLRTLVAITILVVSWVSLEPFSGGRLVPVGEVEGGNLINQIGFTTLFGVAVATCACCVPTQSLVRLLSAPWLLALMLLAVSVVFAPDPAAAIRAYLFTVFTLITAATIVVLPRNADDFCRMILFAGGGVLFLCYAGLVVMPQAAIHQASEIESQHAGLWRGLFTHKNVAGPIMASLVFAGIYMMRRGWRISGFALTVAAAVFVYNTGSKTSAALVPLVVLMVLVPAFCGLRLLGAIAVVCAIAGTHALTIGTTIVPLFDDILRIFDETTTFTGRTEIWAFAKDFVLTRPITGYGFDGFWQSNTTLGAEVYFDQNWDPRRIIHGHNGFLDITLNFGLPFLVLAVWLVVIGPARAYTRTLRHRENQLMADFFFMIVAFTGMNAALESFYFQRSDPVWLTLVIALFGLRMTNHFRVLSR